MPYHTLRTITEQRHRQTYMDKFTKCMYIIVGIALVCTHLTLSLKTTFYVGPEVKKLDFMNDVAAKIPAMWNAFGIQLEIPKGKLDHIQVEFGRHPTITEPFGKIYDLWEKEKTKPVTWKTVIDILKEASFSEIALSEELSKKYEW